jgi:hypothetical protein
VTGERKKLLLLKKQIRRGSGSFLKNKSGGNSADFSENVSK